MKAAIEPLLWFYWHVVSKLANWAYYRFASSTKNNMKLVWLAGYAKAKANSYLLNQGE